MKFLPDAESISAEIKKLINSQSSELPICIAVAFWGRGSESLIVDENRKYQIICNLTSGGTNPSVIRKLATINNVDIKQHRTLHAKVVVAEKGAIISSSNFSTNGLMLEGVDSKTWQEAGIMVHQSNHLIQECGAWFKVLWEKAEQITEADLLAAEKAWNQRMLQQPTETSSDTFSTIVERKLTPYKTVHFIGRIKPKQRNLRSASAIMALGGQSGNSMPFGPFVFLFSGGRTRRAYDNHKNKFEVHEESVRIKQDYVGYFVGEDGKMESCTDSKRRKSFDYQLLQRASQWMLGQGPRPEELEGSEESASLMS